MTISTTSSTVTAAGNGATTSFDFPFVYDSAANITVSLIDATGAETVLVQGSQYTLSLNPPGQGQIWGVGGTVTYPLTGSPIATGTYLVISRVVPLTQLISIANQGAFYPQIVEKAMDILEMQIQEVEYQASRAIVVNPADQSPSTPLPPAAVRANQYAFFDSQGNLTAGLPAVSGAIISAAMQPVVAASTTTDALALLGTFGSFANIENLRANNVTQPVLVYVEGYFSGNDGGEGPFWLNVADTTSADNGGTVIVDMAGNRWYRLTQNDGLSAGWFGALADGTTDNTDALNAALAALPSGGGKIYFSPGRFYFASAISYSYPATNNYAVTLTGAGSNVTTLYWNGTNGLTFNCQKATHSFHMEGMTLSTGKAGTYNGLTLNNSVLEGNFAQSVLRDVSVRGDDGGQQTQYWGVGVKVVGLSNINFYSLLVFGDGPGTGGTGLSVEGNASTSPYFGLVYNLFGCGFYNNGIGFNYGTKIQGVSISTTNFTNGVTGILVAAGADGSAQLTVIGSQINTQDNQISILAPLASLIVVGNVLFVPANGSGILWGVDQGSGNQNTIVGNTFAGQSTTGSTGIAAVSGIGIGNTSVSGNTFFQLDTGINLAGGNDWAIGLNSFSDVTTPVSNPAGGGNNHISVPALLTGPAAANTGSATTSLNVTSSDFTAPCTGTMYVFGDAHSTGTGMATCTLSASQSGLVTTASSGFGSGGSAAGYLQMQMDDVSNFVCAATQSSASLLVSVRCMFVPAPS